MEGEDSANGGREQRFGSKIYIKVSRNGRIRTRAAEKCCQWQWRKRNEAAFMEGAIAHWTSHNFPVYNQRMATTRPTAKWQVKTGVRPLWWQEQVQLVLLWADNSYSDSTSFRFWFLTAFNYNSLRVEGKKMSHEKKPTTKQTYIRNLIRGKPFTMKTSSVLSRQAGSETHVVKHSQWDRVKKLQQLAAS